MIVGTRGSLLRMVVWQWQLALLLVASASVVAYAEQTWHGPWTALPTTPVTIVGAALGIFVSFRTNAAYDRWWEGRKLWGGLVNASRHFATQVKTYVADDALARRLILRHVGYVHVFRCLLRDQDPFADSDVQRFCAQDLQHMRGQSNPTHALVDLQLQALTAEANAGRLSEQRLLSLDASLRSTLDVQGGCERIKRTPMPRGYGLMTRRLVQAYGILFPLCIVHEMGWLAVPLNLLVGLSFGLISEVGRVLEDPFTMYVNGLPLRSLSITIERNLRQLLGDAQLPEQPAPDARGILM